MIYSEELRLMIMEAEKSYSRLSASWRPRKASGVIQSESACLRTRGADGINPSLRVGEDRCPGSCSQGGRGMNPPFLYTVFC